MGCHSNIYVMLKQLLFFISLTMVLYISDECCTEVYIYYFILYLFEVIDESFFNLTMLTERGIFLKNYVSCSLCQNITSLLNSNNLRKLSTSCFTYLVQTKIWKLVCRFDLSNCNNLSNFEAFLLDNI